MDERQQLIRLRGWRIAFATMLAVLLVNLVCLQMGVQLFASQQIFALTMLFASSGISIAYFVWNGAYFRGNRKGWGIGFAWLALGVFWLLMIWQNVQWFGLSHFVGRHGLTTESFQIEMCLWSLTLAIAMIASGWRDEHEED